MSGSSNPRKAAKLTERGKLGSVTTTHFCLAAALCWASCSYADTNVSVTTLADSGTGSLRWALQIVNGAGGGSISFPTLSGTIAVQTTNLPDITTPISLLGPGASILSVSGSGKFRVLRIRPGGSAFLSGLTIKDGNADCDSYLWPAATGCNGGGILSEGPLIIQDCCITNNRDQNALMREAGGGIASSVSLTMSNVVVRHNTGYIAGGISSSGPFAMTNCSVVGNWAHIGPGGISCSGPFSIVNCEIDGNGSNDTGGMSMAGNGLIRESSISGNWAGSWGFPAGFDYSGGTLSLVNSTVSWNYADYSGSQTNVGSAIRSSGNILALNCTIVSNRVTGYVLIAAIYNHGSGTFSIKNTILADNLPGMYYGDTNAAAPEFSGVLTSLGYNIICNPTNAVITGDLTGNQYHVDPRLGPWAYNGGATRSHALLSGSPAIDAGTIFGAPATDQRGVPRPQGHQVDIGAFEAPCPQCGPLLITGISPVPDGCATLTASGIPGDICLILASTNCVDWQSVGCATNAGGWLSFTDPSAATCRNRLYRLQRIGPPVF